MLACVAQATFGRQVHRTSQQLFEVASKAGLLEESLSALHVDEQIQIAFRSGVSSGNRPEHSHTLGAVK